MAEPLDSAFTLLSSIPDAVRQVYLPKFYEMSFRFGNRYNRLFTPDNRRVNGDGINVQVMDKHTYNAAIGRSINGAFPTPTGFGADAYKATLSETDSSNDFTDLKGSCRVTILELMRVSSGQVAAVDVAEKLATELVQDAAELMAAARQVPASGLIATLTSDAPKQNDKPTFADCTATPAASTGARFQLLSGPIAFFQRGRRFKVYNPSTNVYRSTLEVADVNPADNSVGVWLVNDTTNQTDKTTAITSAKVTLSDTLYLCTRNSGMKSVGEWFATPASGDSFFQNDRTTPDARWMIPTKYHAGATASATSVFTKVHFDSLALTMQGVTEDPEGGYVVSTTPALQQKFINQIGEQVILPYPTSEQSGKLTAQYGFDGLPIYRHPWMGRIVLSADPLAPANTIRGLRMGDWKTLNGLPDSPFMLIPANEGNGFWYREQAGTPNTGKGTTWRMDGMGLACDICTSPRTQWAITGITV